MTIDKSQLLEALMASRTGNGQSANIEALLGQMDDVDPRTRLIASYLAQQNADVDDEDDPELETAVANDNDAYPVYEELEQQQQLIHRMQRQLKGLVSELRQLQGRNDALAAALGACELCWGEDPDCESCRGRDSPGTYMPDQEMFIQFVMPVMRKLRGVKESNNTVIEQKGR